MPSSSAPLLGVAIKKILAIRQKQDSQNVSRRPGQLGRPPSKFSLRNFYVYCGEIELARKSSIQTFPFRGSPDAGRDYLNRLFKTGPNPVQEEVLTLALDLPEGFFRQNFASIDDCVNAAKEVWNIPFAQEPQLPQGFLRIDSEDHSPFYRQEEFAKFDAFVEMSRKGQPALMVVHGPTMIGKSYLVSQWFWSRGSGQFSASVRIDCQNLSFDQILESVRAGFAKFDPGLGLLLFLDGLRIERDGATFSFLCPGKQKEDFADLFTLIDQIWSELGTFTVFVGVENNARTIARADLVKLVRQDAILSEHEVKPLSQDLGEKFLYKRGVRRSSKADRIQIARHYAGIPSFLDAVAKEMEAMTSSGRQEFMANLSSETMPPSVARPMEFFNEWLRRHEEQFELNAESGRQMAHPKAFLRLLALMSGSVEIKELREISDRVRIRRISGFDIENSRLRDLPFVNEVENDTFILHPAAKQFFRDELAASLDSVGGDAFCTRRELEAIHWWAANIRQRALRNSHEAKPFRVRLVEAFVYHVCEQIMLIPNADTTARLSRKRVSQPLSIRNEADFKDAPGLLTGGQLWQVAYKEAERFLLDPEKAATRVHGQFEAKARILTKLLETAQAREISVSVHQSNLYKEIAVCWMHAGRLELAMNTLRQHNLAQDETSWSVLTERARIEAGILLRRGEFDSLKNLLSPLQADATRIALLAKRSATSPRISMEVRGAVKILSRLADLAYYQGHISQALVFLTQAERTQALYDPGLLNGQAARTYVLASFTLPGSSAELQSRAMELLERNIAYIVSRKSSPDAPMTNEEISFNILRAGVERKLGQVGRASILMAKLGREPAIKHQDGNFFTLAEFDIENMRIELATMLNERQVSLTGQSSVDGLIDPQFVKQEEELLGRIIKLTLQMKDHGHVLLQIDAMILQCEVLNGEKRYEMLDKIDELIHRHGYELRLVDLGVLKRNGSPVLELGL